MSGKLIVIVPIGDSISYDAASSEEEGVFCKGCNEVIAIRRYGKHMEHCRYN